MPPRPTPTTEAATAQTMETPNPGTADVAAVIATEGVSIMCPHCHNRVVPVVVIRRSFVTVILAALSCLLCLWPCAICLYCCPCGVQVEHYCPMCGRLIVMQPPR